MFLPLLSPLTSAVVWVRRTALHGGERLTFLLQSGPQAEFFLAELACMMYRTVLVYLTVCGVASVLGGKPRARKEPRAGGTRDPAAIAADAPAPGGTPPAGEWELRGRCSVGRAQCSVTPVCLCAREQRPVPGEGDLSVWGSRVVSWTLLRVPVWERSSQLSLHSLHWWW